MATDFLLPDLGEGLTDAEIVRWLVKAGDEVTLNQVICEVETAKALVELPSPIVGIVSSLRVAEGETVMVGSPIISFGANEAAAESEREPEEDGRSNMLVGYGPGGAPSSALRTDCNNAFACACACACAGAGQATGARARAASRARPGDRHRHGIEWRRHPFGCRGRRWFSEIARLRRHGR
jgi:pyruvate/2-oxoglutarate dehydrogenase complex dihydrolipoamide acyltransferase (E2) component